MRAAFIRGLIRAASDNPRVMLITGDLGYRFLEPFAEKFPERFLNIGVAEANLVTVAAGLATTGFIPFIYSIATFASLRPFEQIRTDIVMQKLNVKIVAIGAGLAYTKAGPTHHSMEDIAIMRMMPDMTIVSPVDTAEAESATREIAVHVGPGYLRLEHNPDQSYHAILPKFVIGKGYEVNHGKRIAILVTGTKVGLALKVAKDVHASVYAFPTIKPLDTALIEKIRRSHQILVTLEEHRVTGGFGTAVGEFLLGRNYNNRLIKIGLKDEFTPISADYRRLLEYHGLTAKQIVEIL